ncbi:hypothetical protein FV220_01830 [Methylobacterium sp. WL19]|nr:hypothetical protein FV220_01830 [Methylobacterium sp. WL19]
MALGRHPDGAKVHMTRIEALTAALAWEIAGLPVEQQVDALNQTRRALHEVGPFRAEPVDLVTWVRPRTLVSNPCAPKAAVSNDMDMLHVSIREDGFTQPIVTFPAGETRVLVDGVHRARIGRDMPDLRDRMHGYLPVVGIDKAEHDRKGTTMRHNWPWGRHHETGTEVEA